MKVNCFSVNLMRKTGRKFLLGEIMEIQIFRVSVKINSKLVET